MISKTGVIFSALKRVMTKYFTINIFEREFFGFPDRIIDIDNRIHLKQNFIYFRINYSFRNNKINWKSRK